MDDKEERHKIYEILSKTDDMCYAGQWKEIMEWGQKLVLDPEATPTMLLTWICNGKFTCYHGKLHDEYIKLFNDIDARIEKELGRERADKLLKGWRDELNRYLESLKTNPSPQ